MKSENEKQTSIWWQPALSLFVRLSAWVAFPVIIATFIGQWLDKKYDSAPFGLLGVVGVAFVFSMIGLVYEASKEYGKFNKKNDSRKEDVCTDKQLAPHDILK
ncbi:TPA: hypothetical protein DDY55_00625 [Candidatus Falkowbacteria bacterium]|nr:hypothetical protein [Candidatus Falkowbacteria bacterium]HAY12353.1 hypothetical protein [Candidatus Falkowbacteria bacterium]HBI96611.1 hypothetical protein [Candidatus Falkowbacteria bacterium]HBT27752.1 hypothetical protein [Candidatus Falkowbacteria bacterium]HBY15163.1 hypothetical protein [Candidatus Falkowbacteria bacterium]